MSDQETEFDPDLFVAWLAYVGKGRIEEMRSTLCWAASVDRGDANEWLTVLGRLGHCVVDWRNRTWSARPLQVTPLPGPVQCSLVLGTRPHPDLAEGLDGFVTACAPGTAGGIPLPATLWFEGSEKEAAEILGVELIPCEAARIAEDLRPASPGRVTQGPARTTRLKYFSLSTLQFRWSRSNRIWPDGFYAYEGHGKWYYVLRRDQKWYEVERAVGVYLATSPDHTPVEWVPESEDQRGDLALGRLRVKKGAQLPSDQDYAAIMCTGLPPLTIEDRIVYDGVPLWIAKKIADSLHRELEIL